MRGRETRERETRGVETRGREIWERDTRGRDTWGRETRVRDIRGREKQESREGPSSFKADTLRGNNTPHKQCLHLTCKWRQTVRLVLVTLVTITTCLQVVALLPCC